MENFTITFRNKLKIGVINKKNDYIHIGKNTFVYFREENLEKKYYIAKPLFLYILRYFI